MIWPDFLSHITEFVKKKSPPSNWDDQYHVGPLRLRGHLQATWKLRQLEVWSIWMISFFFGLQTSTLKTMCFSQRNPIINMIADPILVWMFWSRPPSKQPLRIWWMYRKALLSGGGKDAMKHHEVVSNILKRCLFSTFFHLLKMTKFDKYFHLSWNFGVASSQKWPPRSFHFQYRGYL